MNIPVKYTESATPVNVVYEGLCNHADHYEDTLDSEYFNGQGFVAASTEVLICSCGVWKLKDEIGWRE